MIVLGFDTATRSTAVALRLADGRTLQLRDDPAAEEHPGHATRLLGMADRLLVDAGIGWSALQRIAVGRGPGTFTGLRVGVATARGLAQSLGVELVGVSSLRALAESVDHDRDREEAAPARDRDGILAVLDARRGEAFAAAYLTAGQDPVEELVSPRALAPEELGGVLVQAAAGRVAGRDRRWLAIGDGALRFRAELEAAGATVPAEDSPVHLLSAAAICKLGALAPAAAPDRAILPEYGRRPDAEIALERRRATAVGQAEVAAPAGEGEAP
jgi:tRNA threonylcarbamoyladenosine biosynthesis protein TsaB